MAEAFRIKLPDQFSFTPGAWEKWRKRFDRFRSASELDQKDAKVQIDTLLFSMGEKAEDIFLTIPEADRKEYKKVVAAFDKFFIAKRNIVYERARFNSREQEPGESMESFIASLYNLVEHCEYGALKDELIRDRIVVGVRNKTLSEKLQVTDNLNLEKAKTMARQYEDVVNQQEVVRPSQSQSNLDAVRASANGGQKGKQKFTGGPKLGGGKYQPRYCEYCGKTPSHDRQNCPAKNSNCNRCGKRGHWARWCRSDQGRSVRNVEEEQYSANGQQSDFFLGEIRAEEKPVVSEVNMPYKPKPWVASILVGQKNIPFKIDCGCLLYTSPSPRD